MKSLIRSPLCLESLIRGNLGLESLIRVNLRLKNLIRDYFGLEGLIRKKSPTDSKGRSPSEGIFINWRAGCYL